MSAVKSSALAVAVILLLSYFYLYPGVQILFEQRTDVVMSDGTDPTTWPYQADRLVETWKNNPANMFYGSIYDPVGDGDRGTSLWIPWNERWLVVFYANFFPIEQVSTAFIATIMILNGIFMFGLGRYLGWHYLLSLGLGIAWAFNCYTRARAKVHGALAGTFHLPLIFIGLFLVARGKSWRSTVLAAGAFLLAGTVAHYYLVTCVFLSPLFLLFLVLQPEFKKNGRKIMLRLGYAVLPLVLFLSWNRWMPVPSGAKMTGAQSMNNEWLDSPEISPYLRVFRASPLDYLGGDISLGQDLDINPIRGLINDVIKDNLNNSNPHERTQGIRWTIIALALLGLIFLVRGRYNKDLSTKRTMIFFAIFALFTFWMSLGPEAPIPLFSPAYWIYSFDHHVRVANRAGINVHFSFLMIAGLLITQSGWFKKYKWAPWAFLALILVDYLPVQSLPIAQVQGRFLELQREKGACGTGIFFPYINQWNAAGEYYVMMQKMRGSDCPNLSSMNDPTKVTALINRFPPNGDYLSRLKNTPSAAIQLENLARCLPLTWIVFHPVVPADWAGDVCKNLGWVFYPDGTCISPDKGQTPKNSLDKCL